MKSVYAQYLAMGLLMASGAMGDVRRQPITERQGSNFRDRAELKKSKGLTLYEYTDGFSCWARNRKNAERKHNNHLQGKI